MSSTGHASAPHRANFAPDTPPPTREALIELAGRGRPWVASSALAAALTAAPRDAGLRFLLARSLAELGLRTLAHEQLDALPDAARALPEGVALAKTIDALHHDREDAERRLARARAAATVLVARSVDLADALEEWERRDTQRERFVARDGNVVWRRVDAHEPHAWRDLADRRDDARAAADRLLAPHAERAPGPVTIEGLRPPWIFLELAPRLVPDATGYHPEIVLLHEDPLELLDGLSMGDTAEHLARANVRVFVGPDAASQYAAWARARFALEPLGPVAPAPWTERPVSPPIAQLTTSLRAEQGEALARRRAEVESLYAGRDASWWSARYASALATDFDEPLRVLIPTCRYTTFVHHAAEDLRRAFTRLGADARLLIEPDDHARLSNLGYLDAVASHRPDLIVLINYPRRSGPFPANVPFVCWIQDQMPHLLDPRVGRSQTPLDFLCGHLYPHLFERYAYPIERAMSVPVVVDANKFHAEPAPAALLERHAGEIAYVSHHSESPGDMRDRLKREVRDERLGRVVDWVHDRLTELVTQMHSRIVLADVASELPDVLRQHLGAQPKPTDVASVKAQVIDPLGERIVRHQTLRWAASIAQRRAWRLNIYGRGWDKGDFADHARGELPHGESLRACYQSASVHLHASPSTVVHQRVMECAASGGLPLCRLTCQMLASQAMVDAALSGAPGDTPIPVTDSPGLMDWCAQTQRLALGSPATFTPHAADLARQRALAPTGKLDWTARWLLGDFAETTFWDEASLERLIERAVTRPAWRENLSAGIRARVHERATTDALAGAIVRQVERSLHAASPQTAAAA
ncbi:MAG: hypothetical protein R3B57_12690 [Phycisphaerales bacterium]